MRPAVFEHPAFPDHALLDSGDGAKLERFGAVVLARPDPQALWRRRLDPAEWTAADLTFVRDADSGGRTGRWKLGPDPNEAARGREPAWTVAFDDATFVVRPTRFKHVGLFPEQAANWLWVRSRAGLLGSERPRLLNLFGYTGAATALAVQAGYEATHVDASKTSLAWAKENLAASGLADDAVRVVLDDALAFVRREARRGSRYEGVLIDPPHYGRGPKGETWRFEQDVADLLESCAAVLSERAFMIVSAYAIGFPPTAFVNLLRDFEGGSVEAGELAIPEEVREGLPRRTLSGGMCARWSRGV